VRAGVYKVGARSSFKENTIAEKEVPIHPGWPSTPLSYLTTYYLTTTDLLTQSPLYVLLNMFGSTSTTLP